MKRERVGAVLVSVWSGINLVLAIGVLAWITLAGRDAPCLSVLLDDAVYRAMDPRAIAVVNALAVIGNAGLAATCALVLAIAWLAPPSRARWSWPTLAAITIPLQGMGFVSDAYLDHRDWLINVGSTAVLAAGLIKMRRTS